ncbi:HAD family hydrolase [Mucilaginibacter sp. McL0603]|uniref:HAD family hydrolase n=1 Tax=Mucilaginibacter sp. McL0603 TaxID=3415670 RepID=UPI003CEDA2B7
MKRALILDLDNTIYPVSSISENLFAPLFEALDQHADSINASDAERVNKIKDEMTRRPFQHIADEFELDAGLKNKMVDILKNISYDLPMQSFDDYQHIRSIPLDKFLVTTGFSKLQWSKVKMLGIEPDFKAIHIVDPEVNQQTKKDVFAGITAAHGYTPEELLVIGDDPGSEIKAAKALDIDTFLYDPENKYPDTQVTYRSANLKDVSDILQQTILILQLSLY